MANRGSNNGDEEDKDTEHAEDKGEDQVQRTRTSRACLVEVDILEWDDGEDMKTRP